MKRPSYCEIMEDVSLGFSKAGVVAGAVYATMGVYYDDAVMVITGTLTSLMCAGSMKYCLDRVYQPQRKAMVELEKSLRTLETLVELSRQNMAKLELATLGNLKN